MIRVLFVCLGNICRSPMAEAIFRHKVHVAGLDNEIEIDSAGTGNWHVGSPPHHETQKVLTAKNISFAGQTARQIEKSDLDTFDYVITMDDANLAGVHALRQEAVHAVVAPLLSYAPEVGLSEVPDPYYVGGYEGVYTLVDAGCDGLLAVIRRDHTL